LLLTRTLRLPADDAKLLRPVYFLTGLLVLQLLLGVASYLSKFTVMLRWPYEIVVLTTTTHLIVGALMLAASLIFTLRAYRRSASALDSLETEVLTEQFSL
jgi:heme A synthase